MGHPWRSRPLLQKLKARHYGALVPCTWCDANTTNLIRPYAAWVGTIYTADQFRAAFAHNWHRLYDLPGVSILTLWPDYMHCKFMGSDAYLYGSILALATWMVDHPALPSYQDRLGRVWTSVKEYWQSNPCDPSSRFRNMKTVFLYEGFQVADYVP